MKKTIGTLFLMLVIGMLSLTQAEAKLIEIQPYDILNVGKVSTKTTNKDYGMGTADVSAQNRAEYEFLSCRKAQIQLERKGIWAKNYKIVKKTMSGWTDCILVSKDFNENNLKPSTREEPKNIKYVDKCYNNKGKQIKCPLK